MFWHTGIYFGMVVQWAKKKKCKTVPPTELCTVSGMTIDTENFSRKVDGKKWNAL